MKNNIAIAIHGGAGTILREKMTSELETAYRMAMEEAIEAGHKILRDGGTAIDAVEAAVLSMEDCPLFNAGKGAVYTASGKHEMDASIMCGKQREAGAVAGVKQIKNPISLARLVMDKSDHVMLAGSGAEEFAKLNDVRFEEDSYFGTEQRYKQWQAAKGSDSFFLDHTDDKKFGTVGAVAIDAEGNLAAATSTGGMTNKKYGRVGDSPVIGAGTWADNTTCAISCTGHGEYFLRAVVAYDVAALMEYKGMSLQEACDEVVMRKLVKMEGEGGLVAIDHKGNIALPFNSEGMYRGSRKGDEPVFTAIFKL